MGSCLDHFYPLTSLQIGDTKANLSRAFLYFAPDSDKFLILVDNQSWLKSKRSRCTLMKEFVMTIYRSSVFINSRPLLRSSSFCLSSSIPETKTENLFEWFPILNMAKWREKTQFSEGNLHKALHGFIVFEVSWKDVRGIKYLNELQTDTSLALEVKSLIKWEFFSEKSNLH
ncbi:hypothetical protein L484_007044 [Morus notabilis]|uniref:Uncharacterized protein n=1 Tax=Morus notabilis TaxID=981085 RepID=W9RNA1_9ROSA|nr:hypothetical protein L484_007044 [Morus notabilis]